MKIAILSLFPEMFDSFLSTSIIGRAREEQLIDIRPVDIRRAGMGVPVSLNKKIVGLDFAEKEDGSWMIIETGDGQVSGLSEGQDPRAFYRALYQAMTRSLEWRWCLVGNIRETRECGEDKEIRYGTKHFSGGTKVYLAPAQWGDGYENVVVIGKPRHKKGFIEIVLRLKYMTNFRLQKVFDPHLLNRMDKSKYSWWENRDTDRELIEKMLQWVNNPPLRA